MRISVLFSSCVLLLPIVLSFDPGWTKGLVASNDATHYSMTECALLQVASDYMNLIYGITSIQSVLNVANGRCETKTVYDTIYNELNRLRIDKSRLSSAIETIAQSNKRRDLVEAFSEATHFDGEAFDDGALLISQRLDAAISSMRTPDYEKARQSFGALLHTVQDFYSHSNWIEIGHRVPNQGIGKYQILGKYASGEMRTCIDCEGDTCRVSIEPSITENNVLTSGYFGLKVLGITADTVTKPLGKCSHGGSFDYTVKTDARGGGINKDTLTSDHGHLHTIAASVAYNATKQILTEFWAQIGDQLFGQFLGLSTNLRNLSANSLIIVMDTTGSMGPYISMAKEIAISIVNIHKTLEYKPSNYILSPFNDPTWGPVTVSTNPQTFTNAISNLAAIGGGDEPELYYHGIVEALRVCETGSFLYAFTDAPAKDGYLKSQAIQLARERSVAVTLFYARASARMGQTGRTLNTTTDVIDTLGTSNGNDLSSLTGGVIMNVNSQSLNATRDYIIQRLESNKLQTILLANGFNTNFTFHVDSSIESLQIEVFSSSSLSATTIFRLTKPSGNVLSLTPTSQTSYTRTYTVPIISSDIGRWHLMSYMNANHTIQLSGISRLSCSSKLQKRTLIASSNSSFTSLTGKPVKQAADLFVLTTCDNLMSDLQTGYVSLMDVSDGSLTQQVLSPIQIFPSGFLSKMTVPDVDFRLSTVVQLKDNTTIQRQEKNIVSPTSISLIINGQPYVVIRNNTVRMNYTIYNYGQTELVTILRVIDTAGLLPSSGIQETYSIPRQSNISGSIPMTATITDETDFNSTVVTDSVSFSIAALDYEYDETVSVYIQRRNIPLTNQSNYQQPPSPIRSKSEACCVNIILMLLISVFCLYASLNTNSFF